MDHRKLIDDFEGGLISPDSFHHADHVHLAFAYLSEYSILAALERFTGALKQFAVANGKPQLYNETITCAYFFLIRERIARDGVRDWQEFARLNPDLLTWRDGILSRYYCEATLRSDLARNVFVFPDRFP
ncbi:MAG: hypothetical protein WBP97_06180 [Candidatus Sulfotelmatobacter sp.]